MKSKFLNGYKANFNTLQEAIKSGHIALLECQDRKTKKKVAVVVAVNREENGDFSFVPMAKMFDGNPYDELNPPK